MSDIEDVHAGALGTGRSKRITLTAGTTAIVVVPPAGAWGYLNVINGSSTAIVSVGINETPVAAVASVPPVIGDWKIGYDIGPSGQQMIPLQNPVTSIVVLSDTATTAVVLNLIS